ncbi:hypothetical protein ACTFIZ_008838 [Dictyostelium cf. discoideum]
MEKTTKTTTTKTTTGGVGTNERDLGDATRSLGEKIKDVATDLKNTFVESLPTKSSFGRDPTRAEDDPKDHYRHEKKTEVVDPVTGVKTEHFEKTEKVTK